MESTLREGGTKPDLKLIETMLWDGAGVPRLVLHQARLAAGCTALGWTVPDIATAISALHLHDAARLRLTADRRGAVAVTVAPLPASPDVWRLGLAPARLASDDPWLTVKSTRRAAYDAARAALPAGVDEAVFLNERGEVCDGTITTLFFDRGQGLRTPPLACGLLPGVLRAQLLAAGQVREEVLYGADLAAARLFVGNALRGLTAAIWAGGSA